jgi:uncharacterized protein YggT (Ycf19 family)
MSTEHKEHVRVVQDEGFEQRQRIVERTPSTRRVIVTRLSQLIWLITAVIVILLGFRFVFMLLGANPTNTFASIIYNITNVLVSPFAGLLNMPTLGDGSVIDVVALIAMIVYLFGAWVIVELLKIVLGDSGGFRRVKTIRRERMN